VCVREREVARGRGDTTVATLETDEDVNSMAHRDAVYTALAPELFPALPSGRPGHKHGCKQRASSLSHQEPRFV
jgi:hypothetical protein